MNQIIYRGILFYEPDRSGNTEQKYYERIFYKIKKGKFKRLPCEICGCEKTDAHHETYDDNPVIRWLCHKHHINIHAIFRKEKRLKLLESYFKKHHKEL